MPKLTNLRPRLATLDTSAAKVPEKVADPHYLTPEHRAWREEVIRRAGGRCQEPNCGRTGVRLFADHIVELKDGGAPFDLENGRAVCGRCHSVKTIAERTKRMARPSV